MVKGYSLLSDSSQTARRLPAAYQRRRQHPCVVAAVGSKSRSVAAQEVAGARRPPLGGGQSREVPVGVVAAGRRGMQRGRARKAFPPASGLGGHWGIDVVEV